MKKLLLVIVLVSTLVLTWCTWTKKTTSDTSMNKENVVMQQEKMKQDEMVQKDDAMMWTGTTGQQQTTQQDAMQKDSMSQKDEWVQDTMMKKDPASYIPYDEVTAKSLLAAWKNVVLFFHAWRCPSCKSLDRELAAQLSTLPENSVVLKVDYDNSTDLKKKYEVRSQHTLVRIDSEMNLVAKQTWGDAEAVAKMLQ